MTQESTLSVRYMQIEDIPQVVKIDKLSFTPAWPAHSYRFELIESNVSYMVVLQKFGVRPTNRLQRVWRSLRGVPMHEEEPAQNFIAGYGGLWKIAEEAHISTIAIHPDFRGNRYGELLLLAMIRRAIALQAGYLVLEVRVSNQIALNLYHKYGFEVHGVKANYYQNNGEDAYDMRIDLTPDVIARFEECYHSICQKITFLDTYSTTPHPRLNK